MKHTNKSSLYIIGSLTITTINGVTADFNTGNAYWSYYVNGGYCNYGASSQPVEDGDAFVIKYEVYTTE